MGRQDAVVARGVERAETAPKTLIVLALDTALDACAVAIVRDGEVLAHLVEAMTRGQAERLAPMVQEVAKQASIEFAAIDRIAVTTGPGSFTGVRVGLSFARALALALGKPCIGVSTLESIALLDGEGGRRAALVETPGAAYLAFYENAVPLIAPRAIERGEHHTSLAAASSGRPFTLVGPGATPDVIALARRAMRLDPAAYAPHPLYLRAPHVTPEPPS